MDAEIIAPLSATEREVALANGATALVDDEKGIAHPLRADALDTTEANLCVERIVAYQNEHKLSDLELVRKFPALGSSRSWRSRLAVKNWAAAPLTRWLPSLQEVVAKIEGRADTAAPSVAPVTLVVRHLTEAETCRRERHLALARSHCRAARQAIETFQRTLTP